jgi:hypothetical protein
VTLCAECGESEATNGAVCAPCWVGLAGHALGMFDVLADLAVVALERGHRIVLEPHETGGGWTVYIGPAALDFPFVFAQRGDLMAALEAVHALGRG